MIVVKRQKKRIEIKRGETLPLKTILYFFMFQRFLRGALHCTVQHFGGNCVMGALHSDEEQNELGVILMHIRSICPDPGIMILSKSSIV